MKYRNIFFDFDGVVAESLSVKTDAFYKMYLPFGENIAKKVVEHHKMNGGMSRFEKFKLYHKKYLYQELSEDEINKMANDFSGMVLQGVIDAKLVNGVEEFILNHKNFCRMWIVSGTPTSEIRKIAVGKNLSKYFEGVFGSPESKSFWLEDIITRENLTKEEIVFLGDATVDYEAAKKVNIDFALRETDENESLFKNIKDIIRFKDFFQLNQILNNQK